MLNKFKHSKAEQTTLASKLPSSQLNYPQQHNRRKTYVAIQERKSVMECSFSPMILKMYLSLKSQTICVIWRRSSENHRRALESRSRRKSSQENPSFVHADVGVV
ncbi:hypothetical protein F2Q69_00009693 [Brassica cretica]|uniref:Uncharacterized protein n=1 Tax=Brassica cretica TaxID=69181 RepID=A0A8S9PLA3_BRACR|nr:hypothetical protein F2Q69_00009693 [Brassica cretica]